MSPTLPPNLDLNRLRDDINVELARRNLFDFAKFLAPTNYVWNWHHATYYQKLNDFAWGRVRRMLVKMPPRHGKSEGASRNLPAYILGHNPNERIIACSYTQGLAGDFNRDVQNIIDSEPYRRVFPALQLGTENVRALAGKPRRNSEIFDVPGHKGYYKAAGVGTGITGKGFSVGLIDDPIKDREQANSAAYREMTWRWYTSTFMTRAEKDARVLVAGTPWHDDDLINRIEKRILSGDEEPWEIIEFPAISDDRENQHDPRQSGEALWPWFKTAEELEAIRRREPRDFAALYQLRPRAEGGTEWPTWYFDRPDFWYSAPPLKKSFRTLFYDGAGTPGAKVGDWHACAILTITEDGHLWFDVRLWRGPQEQAAAELCSIMLESHPDACGIETNFGGAVMIPLIGHAAQAAGRPDLVGKWMGVNNTLPKVTRIRRLGTYLAQGLVHLRESAAGRETLRQMEQFPVGEHDDGPDAMDGALQLASHLLSGG